MNVKYQLTFLLKRIYWFVVRPRTSGVKCVLENQGKVLMIRRTFGTDKWVFPGGAVRAGEEASVAAPREIQEDLGVRPEGLRDLGSFTQEVFHRQETMHCFAGSVSPDALNYDKEKIREVRWFALNELPELTPVSRSVMALYRV